MSGRFWSAHTHSRYSGVVSRADALASPEALVQRAYELGHPALGLTDHGGVPGLVKLYKSCRKKGLEPVPGIELYITPDHGLRLQGNQHLTVLAYTEIGYRNLVDLANLAARQFFYKPRVDYADLAAMAEARRTDGLAVLTGCYSGGLTQALVTKGGSAGRSSAEQVLRALQGWFPRVYVELMNHGIHWGKGVYDQHIVAALAGLADEVGVPYIITTDCHYLDRTDQPAHDAVKRLLGFGDDPSEAQFMGSGYWLMSETEATAKFAPEIAERALDNLAGFAAACKVRVPELDHFSLKVPDVSKTGEPDDELRKIAQAGLDEITAGWPASKVARYQARLDEELETVRVATMAGYLLLVNWICEQMRERGIWYYARGSAAGSLTVHALKISYKDPLPWGLLMERFMGKDRTRPPDIDLDVEHTRRDEVVQLLIDSGLAVQQVGSHMQMSITGEEVDEGRGSLLVKYYSTAKKVLGDKAPQTWDAVPPEDRRMLSDLSARKLISGPGTHAAGYIVAPDYDSIAQIPLSWMANRKAFVTAYGKKDVEAAGFVKIDLLGSRTLTAIRVACEALGMTRQQWEHLPENDKETFRRFSSGQVAGSFQAEGGSQRRGFRDLKPSKLADIVAGQALYRPAMLGANGGAAQYLRRRQGREPVPEQHPDIREATKDTFGIALYQEQVMALMKAIGMGPDQMTDMLDAVKASNAASIDAAVYLKEAREEVGELARTRGWSESDVDWLVSGLAGYAEYSFNKSHSVIYGDVAYRTVYQSAHTPVAFWLGVLVAHSIPKHKKEPFYVSQARKPPYSVEIAAAHVNASGITYRRETVQRGGKQIERIRRGFLSVSGVGPVAATELASKAPYRSLTDLGERVLASKVSGARDLALGKPLTEAVGVVAALQRSNALTGLPVTHQESPS